jgi:septation ring formation regulator EzrA
MQGRAIVLTSTPSRDGEISMNEEQLQKIGQSLQEILAELRTINAREERRDQKNNAVQDRFANL